MKNRQAKHPDNRVLMEAARWYAETRDGNLSRRDRNGLQKWLSENSEHQAAFDEISKTASRVDDLFPENSPEWKGAIGRWTGTEKDPAPKHKRHSQRPAVRPSPFSGWRWVWKPAMAAMFMLVLLIGQFFMGDMLERPEIALEYFHTDIGEKREVVLKDGSRMVLNTKSTVVTKFGGDQRLVELTEGEVFFDVVKDRERPFLVCASSGEIRVVGTAFNVLNRGKEVSVGVIRGRVQVRKTGGREYEPNGRVILEAGQGASYSEWGQIEKPGIRRADEVLSWQREKLFFHSEPLSEVLRQLEDYYPVHFILEDSSIAGQRLTGTFRNRSLDEILDSILAAFDLRAEQQDALIVLKKLEGEK